MVMVVEAGPGDTNNKTYVHLMVTCSTGESNWKLAGTSNNSRSRCAGIIGIRAAGTSAINMSKYYGTRKCRMLLYRDR
jgi:hypothetical protein